jgi:tetratricopeptide (TPR) repeat protein
MRIRVVTLATLVVLSVAVVRAQNGNDLYQQGLARETAGDLKGAVQIFERIVRDFSSNRTLAARALVRLGEWSSLLGQDQARTYYERVIREFADQKEAATEARARLDALPKAAAPAASPARRLAVDWMERYRTGQPGYEPLAPDGRHLLRYNEKQRAFEEIEIVTNGVQQLTSDGPNPTEAYPWGGLLSKDRRKLASMVRIPTTGRPPQFASDLDPGRNAAQIELRVFDIGGRGPGRVLASWDPQELGRFTVRPFAWSPQTDRVWLFAFRKDLSAQIVSVDLAGKLEVLKTLAWRDHSQLPSLSPDGRFITYHDTPDRQAPPDIFILATDGSREQRLEHPADDSKSMFAPDGSGIVFESSRRGPRDIWFQAVTDGRAAGQPRLVMRNLGFGQAELFSDSGSLYYYFATNDWGTYTVALDVNASAGSVAQPARVLPVANETNSGAAFSPDGRYLAHFRANAARLVIRDLTSGGEREIPFGTQLSSGYALADWCSTSETLIATGYLNQGGPAAYRVSVKDSSVQRLPISPDLAALCIGNGEEVIYVPSATRDSIVRRSLVSGRESTIFKGPIRALARSADGKRLAVVTFDANVGAGQLVTMSATGGDVTAALMQAGTGQGPGRRLPLLQDVAWMPSGDRLLVNVYEEGDGFGEQAPRPSWLWEVPLTGGAPRKLGLLSLPFSTAGGRSSFSMHPDGRQLAFQRNDGYVQQTWAIDNLLQFIKAGGGWEQ